MAVSPSRSITSLMRRVYSREDKASNCAGKRSIFNQFSIHSVILSCGPCAGLFPEQAAIGGGPSPSHESGTRAREPSARALPRAQKAPKTRRAAPAPRRRGRACSRAPAPRTAAGGSAARRYTCSCRRAAGPRPRTRSSPRPCSPGGV